MIRTVSDMLGQFYALYEAGGPPRGISTGWPSLDAFYTVRKGEWTLITGIPGHGKSSLIDNFIVNSARDHDWKWLVFSAENQPAVNHAAQLASIYIGRPFEPSIRQRMSQEEWLYASAFLGTQVQFLEPDESGCNIDAILGWARDSQIKGLVIDPWNELDHSRPASMTETEYISESLSKVRRYAKETGVHVFIVAHPTKLQRQKVMTVDGVEKTIYPVPTPWDVSGSAHWRNKADNCICVWRDVLDETQGTEIHVQKIRFRKVGRVGMCKFYYDPENGQFIDPLTGARPVFSAKQYHADLDAKLERHKQELDRMESELEMAMEREW